MRSTEPKDNARIKENIKEYLRKNRAFLRLFLFLCILATAAVIFTANDYFLYPEKTVAKITDVAETPDHTEYSADGESSETIYLQTITAKVVSGERKGETLNLTNLRSESNVYDTRFYKGDKIFIRFDGDGTPAVENVKRDTYVVAMFAFTLAILILVGRRRGTLAAASVAVNAAIFWFGITAYKDGKNLLGICVLCAVVFTLICLTLIGGFTRMTLIAIKSTLTGTVLTFGIACAVIYGLGFRGLYVEGLEYLVIAADYRVTFMSELLIGGLGATMDIAMSISSALCELKEKDPRIGFSALMRSGREIGRDITGTMTNVLLFTYLCGGIPLMMVIVRSGVPMMKYIFGNNNLEIARFLVGSIGIVLTVPVSYFTASFILSYRRRKAVKSK